MTRERRERRDIEIFLLLLIMDFALETCPSSNTIHSGIRTISDSERGGRMTDVMGVLLDTATLPPYRELDRPRCRSRRADGRFAER